MHTQELHFLLCPFQLQVMEFHMRRPSFNMLSFLHSNEMCSTRMYIERKGIFAGEMGQLLLKKVVFLESVSG